MKVVRVVKVNWPLPREFPADELSEMERAYLSTFISRLGMAMLRNDNFVKRIATQAYEVARHFSANRVANLSPRWFYRRDGFVEFPWTGEHVYAKLTVPEQTVYLLLGFLSREGALDEVLVDLHGYDNQVINDVFLPVMFKKVEWKLNEWLMCITPPMLFVPGDEFAIKLVSYAPPAADVVIPVGLVFYHGPGFLLPTGEV